MRKTFLVTLLCLGMCACNRIAGAVENGMPATATISLLGKTYRLGSFNQKAKPTWEFVTGNETVENWTTLVTVIDRADAPTRPDLDRLGEGIMANYKSHGGQILLARTLPGNWNQDAQRLAVDLNRTILFVNQQQGAALNQGVWLFGPGAVERSRPRFSGRRVTSYSRI